MNPTTMNARHTNVGQHDSDDIFGLLSPSVVTEAIYGTSTGTVEQTICHPDTRRQVLTLIEDWSNSHKTRDQIAWLRGPAGAGKSTIMRTVARDLDRSGLLLGSFFCCASDPRTSNPNLVIPTLLHQIFRKIPALLPMVKTKFDVDPYLASKSADVLLEKCLVEPFKTFDQGQELANSLPHVILIDGLDEFNGGGEKQALITALETLPARLPKFHIRILYASRPEDHVSSPSRYNTSFSLNKDLDQANSDVRTFLQDEFKRIRRVFLSDELDDNWPGDDFRETVVERGSGRFLFPSIIVGILGDPSVSDTPKERVDRILRDFNHLDSLYASVLKATPGDSLKDVLEIVGFLCLTGAGTRNPCLLDALRGTGPGKTVQRLTQLHSLLHISSHSVSPHHHTLAEFIFDSKRSGQFGVHVDKAALQFKFDSLYASFIKKVTSGHLVLDDLEIFGVSLIPYGIKDPAFLDLIYGFESGTTANRLAHLNSLLHISEDSVSEHHQTFLEFILDPTRSAQFDLHVDEHRLRCKLISALMETLAYTSSFPFDDWESCCKLIKCFQSQWRHIHLAAPSDDVEKLRSHILECFSKYPLSQMTGFVFSHILPAILYTLPPPIQFWPHLSFHYQRDTFWFTGKMQIDRNLCQDIEEEVKRRLRSIYTQYGQDGVRLIFVSKAFSLFGSESRSQPNSWTRPSLGDSDPSMKTMFSEHFLKDDMSKGLAFQFHWPDIMTSDAMHPHFWDGILEDWFQENFRPPVPLSCITNSFYHEMVHDFPWILSTIRERSVSLLATDPKFSSMIAKLGCWIEMALLTNHSGLCADTMFVLSRLFSHEWSSPAHHNTALVHVDRFLTRRWKDFGVLDRFHTRLDRHLEIMRKAEYSRRLGCGCGSSTARNRDDKMWREPDTLDRLLEAEANIAARDMLRSTAVPYSLPVSRGDEFLLGAFDRVPAEHHADPTSSSTTAFEGSSRHRAQQIRTRMESDTQFRLAMQVANPPFLGVPVPDHLSWRTSTAGYWDTHPMHEEIQGSMLNLGSGNISGNRLASIGSNYSDLTYGRRGRK